jgi:hypothetical protein
MLSLRRPCRTRRDVIERSAMPESLTDELEAAEEDHVVKGELSELEGLDPEDERFSPNVAVLMENVRPHVREKERTLYPLLMKHLSHATLLELGRALREQKAGPRRDPALVIQRVPRGTPWLMP